MDILPFAFSAHNPTIFRHPRSGTRVFNLARILLFRWPLEMVTYMGFRESNGMPLVLALLVWKLLLPFLLPYLNSNWSSIGMKRLNCIP